MSTSAALQADPAPIVACTISRDVQIFDLLIEDMEAVMGEQWGDLGFAESLAFLEQPEANTLDFIAIALNAEDEDDLPLIIDIIAVAKAHGIKVILITEDVSPASLHQLLREGGDEFVPYPLPEGELANAIARLNDPVPEIAPVPDTPPKRRATDECEAVLIAVTGMAGGTGSTTLAVNLAWELANVDKKTPPKVCLLDLDMQYGAVATYLDLPRRDAVLEMYSDTETLDSDTFLQAVLPYGDKMHVLTAPSDLIPMDFVTGEDVRRVLDVARANFDYVVIDMPHTLVDWSDNILTEAHVYLATLELDLRSAQNALRIKRAIMGEDLPFEKFRFVLNRAPGFTDLNGKARVKRLADSLDIKIELTLPDGGKPVAQACDQGEPLATALPKNGLRKEIAKLAKSIHEINQSDAAAAQT